MNIEFNEEKGEINLSGGEYYDEFPNEVFEPITEWLKQYTKKENKKISLNIKTAHFETGSARYFLEIMALLEDYQHNKNGEVSINWYYRKGNLDMKETAEEYAEDIRLPFNLIVY